MPVDRTRRFALPGIQDLNKDQDEALARPLAGQHLIIGGPGTGKSVVALLRAKRLATSEKTYRTLGLQPLVGSFKSTSFWQGASLFCKDLGFMVSRYLPTFS
jgi:hypothetical protein